MSQHLENAVTILAQGDGSGGQNLKQLPILSVLPMALAGRGFPESRDVGAYDGCIARDQHELAK